MIPLSASGTRTETAPEEPGLLLVLPATAENVAIVRHAVGGLAETLGMDPIAVTDLKTIVSEACTNAAVHAYDQAGPMEVEVRPDESGITVTVRDRGSGIRPKPDLEESRLRLGLPLIAALSTNFSISAGLGQGTEVVMRMDLLTPDTEQPPALAPPESVPGTAIQVSDERIMAPVIGRVLSVLAARTDFTVDRLTDTMLIADALAANAAAAFEDGNIRMIFEDGDGTIRVRVGPMQEGAAQRLRSELEIPGLGATLEVLADDVSVDHSPDGEFFSLRMRPSRP
ncbi:MAG: ATP-binding protein [Actinomycetota bacterium]|nr:ATP-binding protein [Actinomycetota bacterium]